MSESTGAVPGAVPANEPAVERAQHKAKNAKVVEIKERVYKTFHLDTGDEAQFKEFHLAKSEEDPYWDHRQTLDVPAAIVQSLVDEEEPSLIKVVAEGDGYKVWDGRTRLRAVPEANRQRKKLGKKPLRFIIAVTDPPEEVSEVIKGSIRSNIRMEDPPTVLAMHVSRALAADVTEEWLCKTLDMNAKKLHEYLALLDLPKKVQAHVDDGTISIAAALALTRLDEKDVEAAAEKLAAAAKVGKRVSAADVAPKKGDDKVATKKEIKQFALDLDSDPFAGKHGEAVTKAIILGIELCMGLRSIPQAIAAANRIAKGEALKIDFKQFQTDGK